MYWKNDNMPTNLSQVVISPLYAILYVSQKFLISPSEI